MSRFPSDKATWGRCSVVTERDIFRKVDWAWPPASPDPTPVDFFFLVGTLEGARLPSLV